MNGTVHNLLMQFFTLGSLKIEVSEAFLHTVTTQNDHPTYAWCVLGRIYVVFTSFGKCVRWGGVSQGIGTQPAYALFQLGRLKSQSFRGWFFWYPEHTKWPSNLCIVCFRVYLPGFHFIWVMGAGGGGSPKGFVHNLLMQFFTVGSSKIQISGTFFFDTVTTQNDQPRYVKHVLGRIYAGFTLFGGVCC